MTMSNEIRLAALPFELVWVNRPQHWSGDNDNLTIVAGPGTDWFVRPAGGEPKMNAPALVGKVQGDFLMSAHVEVDFKSTYDAGVLALWTTERTWSKLCLEFSPRGENRWWSLSSLKVCPMIATRS
jgi:regulation of enolase protein 1 (concanavalin A-like superfamily)